MEDAAGISSTRIRQALARGEVEQALPLLGYPFTLDLGVPAAREPIDGLVHLRYTVPGTLAIPATGAYAALCQTPLDGGLYLAACLIEDGATLPITLVRREEDGDPTEVEFIARLDPESGTPSGPARLFARAAAAVTHWRRPVFEAAGRL
jgi:hypothetical protein